MGPPEPTKPEFVERGLRQYKVSTGFSQDLLLFLDFDSSLAASSGRLQTEFRGPADPRFTESKGLRLAEKASTAAHRKPPAVLGPKDGQLVVRVDVEL